MTDRELMQQVTDRELIAQAIVALEYHTYQTRPIPNTNLAIEALRARLAQPESEYKSYQCQQCGEVIGWLGRVMPFHKCSQPQREWQGLTDEEMWDVCKTLNVVNIYPAIEAKLREKNT
jgi:hypothetical protein